jgi:threonyl-tRNA synthetase
LDLGGEQAVLRPSLCPHHSVIYRSGSHSYRELPPRIAELGGTYRSELSGVLGGLTRVRAIQLNDAHIFCTLDQVADEARRAVELIGRAHQALGITRPVTASPPRALAASTSPRPSCGSGPPPC